MAQKIPNNYSGKTAEQVWNTWDYNQRLHFWNDHNDIINEKLKYDLGSMENLLNTKAEDLPPQILETVEQHISEVQYKAGGIIDSITNFFTGKTSLNEIFNK